MAFTDHCDIFISLLEAGINRVLNHVRRQRPSLFNYGSQAVRDDESLLCSPIGVHPVVRARLNPVVTVVPQLPAVPILGSNYVIDYCAQLTKAAVDFHPGNVLALPPELGVLAAQRFAIGATVCAGLGCPPDDLVNRLPPSHSTGSSQPAGTPGTSSRGDDRPRRDEPPRPPELLRSRQLRCFCVDGFAVGSVDFVGPIGDQHVVGTLEGLEIVDIKPDGLESALECYAALEVKLVVLPLLAVDAVKMANEDVMGATVAVEPSPVTAALPNNPAVENDQIKVFLDLTAAPGGGGGGGGGGGPVPPPPAPGVDRARVRVGPFDLTLALSDDAVEDLFDAVRDSFTFSKSDSVDFGPFTFSYAIAAHLEGGTIELRNDGTIRIKELDIKWDTAQVCFGIDIPEICIGGFCIIPSPWGCILRAPRICVFSDNPDIEVCLDIGGLITSEISATVTPHMRYSTNHPAAMNDWDARDALIWNRWQLVVDIETLDFDLFDIADIVGDLLHNALEAAVSGLLGFLPGWAQDLVLAILGPIIDLVVAIIDLPDDVGEWLSDLLGVSLGLFNAILTAVANHYAAGHPLLELEDGFPLPIPNVGGLIPVLLPVEFLGVRVNADELILEGDIGN